MKRDAGQKNERRPKRVGLVRNLVLHSQFILIGLLVLTAAVLKVVSGG